MLRVSLVSDERSIPPLSQLVISDKQQNAEIQSAFLSALSHAVGPDKKVIIIKDAGFRNTRFQQVLSPGWDFIGRVRGAVQLKLENQGEQWIRCGQLKIGRAPSAPGLVRLQRAEKNQYHGYFYLHKATLKMRKNISPQVDLSLHHL